jgi:hypothetical protein
MKEGGKTFSSILRRSNNTQSLDVEIEHESLPKTEVDGYQVEVNV